MKPTILSFLCVLILLVGFQVTSFLIDKSEAVKKFEAAKMEFDKAKAEKSAAESDLNYLANPLNLEKEFRSRFNLVRPGERLTIIIPENTSSTSSSTSNP